MSEWISVKDRLPKKYKSVLIYVKPINAEESPSYTIDGPIFAGKFEGGDIWSCLYGDSWIPFSADEITHWMPLPEPPIQNFRAEFGCSSSISCSTSEGIKTLKPGKIYGENWDEIPEPPK